MDSIRWLRHFESNRLDRPEPFWPLASPLGGTAAVELARSLSHFQLGESGEGTVLLKHAARAYPDDPVYTEALRLFVAEEQEHARLLALLVARLGGQLISRHWTHACFRVLRHALGVHFELQTLVVAEIIGAAYYRVVDGRSGDSVVDQVCALMLRDEFPHLDFHRECLAAQHPRGMRRRISALQFKLFAAAATRAAWLDHRRALRALGVRRTEFLGEARTIRNAFLAEPSRPVRSRS